jgi:hypothetical protein
MSLDSCLCWPLGAPAHRHTRCAGDPRNLGPGSYALPDAWKSKSKHGDYKLAPAFFTGASRLSLKSTKGPAPGAYENPDINKVFKPMSQPIAPFGATGARLQTSWASAPGPGRYELAPHWQKRSFNITFDDTVLLC